MLLLLVAAPLASAKSFTDTAAPKKQKKVHQPLRRD
jgi:hypothetical protein